MDYKNVLLLGDSTSMSIGLEREMYSFRLADAKIWPEGSKVFNCSLPGFTSADAAAFFYRHNELWSNRLGAVIIYLGNCDSATSEITKGRYSLFSQLLNKINELFRKKPKKTKLKNKLLRFEWSNSWNSSIEKPELASDFKFNIKRIIKTCSSKKIPVIVLRPKANRYFLPGLGKGNFLFYRFLNVNEQISDAIRIIDVRFKEATTQYENGNIKMASEIYQEILLNDSSNPMSREYALMVVNNYATAQAELGNSSEAKFLLNLLLKEKGVRKEIIFYNLAQINKNNGDIEEYSKFMALSYEADDSMYRIRSPYIKVLDELAKEHPEVVVIDMDNIIPDSDYLDHCHPLPSGQKKLSDRIVKQLKVLGFKGNSSASIKNILYNPELAKGNNLEFHDYFKTASALSETEIAKAIEVIREQVKSTQKIDGSGLSISGVPQSILDSIDYYLRHPCFSILSDLLKSPPQYPCDVGRFPEYFLIRHLIPYLRKHEDNQELRKRFSNSTKLLRSSNDFLSILPEKILKSVDLKLPLMDEVYATNQLNNILCKTRTLLLKHLQQKNQVFGRVKTLIFWYFRETLRFGAHSRFSMLYDRVLLESLAEGLAVAGVIDNEFNLKKENEIKQLIKFIEIVTQAHEKYCSQFSLEYDSRNLLNSYDHELIILAEKLKETKCIH
jgi:hypothetical protein